MNPFSVGDHVRIVNATQYDDDDGKIPMPRWNGVTAIVLEVQDDSNLTLSGENRPDGFTTEFYWVAEELEKINE